MDGTSGTTGEQAERQAGAELRRLRDDRGWSLAEMARQVPYSKSYLSKLETGAKPITPAIARCFDEALGTGGALAAVLAVDDEGESAGAGVCPYPGLAAFGPDQARWFFGRDQVTAQLISQLDDRLVGGGLLAVVAPSGAGKSSLLAAGLVPALAGGALPGSRAWPVVAITPGVHPLAALAASVAQQTGADPAEAAGAAGDPKRFAVFLAGAVAACTGKLGETSSSAGVVLVVDQFEEIFTECRTEAERQAFIAALGTAAYSAAALVVLGVRADFYGSCLAYPALLTALQNPVAVGPMTADQLRAVIMRPAEIEGLDLEPGLVELLLRDLGAMDAVEDAGAGAAGYDPGALPLLAHALRVTWQQREGQMLTVAGYRRTGGIGQALATTADRVYTRLGPAEQQIARQVLLRLVNISDQGASGDTRRRSPRTRLAEALPGSAQAVDTVLEVFGRARLLTLDTASVEITHEALLRAWPRLRQWIDTDRAGNLIRQQLDEAAAGWDRDRRDTAGLYRGSRLEAARTWATSHAHDDDLSLSPTAAAFLAASTAQEHRAARLRRTALVVLSTLLVLALIAAGVAVWQQQQASDAQRTTIARGMVAQADRIRDQDPRGALQLGVAARQFDASPQTHASLLQTLESTSHFRTLNGHANAVNALAFAPDGRTLATASTDRTVRLWDLSNRDQPRPLGAPLTGHTDEVWAVAFASDGRTLATGSADRTVRLWDFSNRDQPRPLGAPLTGHTNTVYAVAFASDGRTLATGSADRTVRLWDLSNRDQPRPLDAPLTGHTNTVYAVAFAPDGRTLATASTDRTVRLWDLSNRDQPRPLDAPLTGHTDSVYGVAFASDGRTLATGIADRTVRLWDLSNRDQPRPLGTPLTGHTDEVNGVAFASDGRTLATGSADRTVRLWDLSNRDHPRPLGTPLTGHTNAVYGVAFAPDGHTVATTSDDQTVRLWDLSTRDHPRPLGTPLTGHTNAVIGVAFAPDGHTVATTSDDRTVRLWDLPRLAGFRGDEVREACLRAGGPLDKPTWDQYAPGISYQDTCAGR